MSRRTVKILQILLLILIIALIALFAGSGSEGENIDGDNSNTEFVNDYFDIKVVLEKNDTSDCFYTVFSGVEREGYVFFSEELEEQTIGYTREIDFAVILDNDKRLEEIEILSHDETPSFIERMKIEGFFNQWNGKTPSEIIDSQSEHISGATISSNAVSKDLMKMMEAFSKRESGMEKYRVGWIIKNLAALLFIVFALINFFFPEKLCRFRWLLLLLSVLILGVWCAYFLSLELLYGWLLHGVILEMQVVLITVFVISVSLPLFTKRSFYCNYVCPFGAAQELLGKLNNSKKELPRPAKRFFRWFRPLLLLVILVLLLLSINIPLSKLEPFSVFAIRSASIAVIILASVMLIFSVFVSKPWCRYFCPTGMMLELLRKPVIRKRKKK